MLRFLTLFCASAILLPAEPAALEDLLGAPFPSQLVSDGQGQIAWVQNERGVRNIWTAQKPAYEAHRLTNYTKDDGMELSDLSLSSDGSMVVFTRGEGGNSANEFPNPRHLLGGVDQTIQAVPFAGGSPRQIGRGHAVAISPDSQTVGFVSNGQVWTATLSGTAAAAQITHNRGRATDLAWSPDSQSLVFTSHRDLHSLIAVYRRGKPSLQFIDPGSDFDSNAAWSPDGKQIAFTRIASTLDWNMHEPRRAAETPWSIRVADADTGAGRQVWQAQAGPGSVFHETASRQQILWVAGDRLVFPWERTGWLHLFSVAATGGTATDLWPDQGDSEVEEVALSRDRAEILCSSNRGDIDKRHVWRIRITGGAGAAPVGRQWIEWAPVFAERDQVAFLHADAQPARVAIVQEPSGAVRNLTPESHPRLLAGTPEQVMFPAADGMQIHGQLFLPADGLPKHPAVIFLHGGSRRQMLLGWNPMFYYYQAYAFNQYLAAKGYVVLSVNYRSGTGYGLNFREALDYGPSGGSEYSDVRGAGIYLRSRPDVMADRIGLWGGSYGGYLTALGLARDSSLFAAGVDLHGVHDWNDEMENDIPADQPARRQELARIALQSSPLAFLSTWRSPVLLIQGDDDRNVNFRQTEILVEALRKQRVPFEELIFPDEIHDFLTYDHWLKAYSAAETFLDKHLKPQVTK